MPASQIVIWQDQKDDCIVGSYCSEGPPMNIEIPHLRGLCVMTAVGKECWDACNTAHTVQQYSGANTKAIAMMVKQLRTGNGPAGAACPGSKSSFVNETICNQGERCTPPGLTWGRGMCVSVGGMGDQCKDMCDTSLPMTMFHDQAGKQAGTLRIVQQVRAGRDPSGLTTCPGLTVWVWLWFPIILCCLIGICGATYYAFSAYRGRMKPRGAYREPSANQQYDQEQNQYDDRYQQEDGMPPPQTMEQMDQMPQTYQDDPMPVAEPLLAEPMYEEKAPAYEVNLFEQPNLFPGLQPLTVAAPSTSYPVQGFTQSFQPVQGFAPAAYSQSMSGVGMPQMASRPAVVSQVYTQPGAAMTTQVPYGAYGAYGGATYPGTTSMRIG